MKRMFPNTFRLVVDRCSSSSGVSGPSFVSKAERSQLKFKFMLYCRQFHSFYFCQFKVLDNYSACKIVLAELYVLGIRKARLDVSLLHACDFPSFGKEFKSPPRDVRLQEPSNLTFA